MADTWVTQDGDQLSPDADPLALVFVE